jgi:2-dehydropantoate 2-reductase
MSTVHTNKDRSTVAVVGLGSIGGGIAGSLCAAGRHDVVACTRRPLDRLIVERAEGTADVPLRTLTDPTTAQPVDWVMLCTKAHETASTAEWLSRLCNRSTRVAVLQNGIDHAARVKPLIGDATVVPALVYYNGERLAADRVRIRHAGEYDLLVSDDAGGRAFVQLLDGTPLRVVTSTDFTTLKWRKLLINAIANPITALTLRRQEVLRQGDIRALCLAILNEAIAVGCADGARLVADEATQTMSTLLGYAPELGTSMYFDRLAGRALEVEALTGAIVAAGERHGIATPLNRALLALLRAISEVAGRNASG